MKPYYEGRGITLYNCDCADLPRFDYDLLIVDPPNKDYESNRGGARAWGKIKGGDDLSGTTDRLLEAIKGLRRGRHVYIFEGELDLSRLPLCGLTELIWDKGVLGPGDLSSPWGPQHERITFATYELSKANREKGYGNLTARLRKGSVLRCMRPQSGGVKHHPTEKPVDILRQMIESSSVLGETVADFFAGSGSTAIAAVLEGRRAIVCEDDEKHCETAAKRFEAELGGAGDLFAA